MTTYRTVVSDSLGRWGVTIVREQEDDQDQLVAVVVNGDQALAERICTLLNGEPCRDRVTGLHLDPCTCRPVAPADSCTCVYRPNGGPDPACPVHQGRRARGPKPPPLGPGCVCDGSGRRCPRHGEVI